MRESMILPYGKMGKMAFEMLAGLIGNPKGGAEERLIKPEEKQEELLKLQAGKPRQGRVRVLFAEQPCGPRGEISV